MDEDMILRLNSGTHRLLILVAVCALVRLTSLAQAPPQVATKTVTIPDGTIVHLFLMDDLNSKKNKAGDEIRFKVRESIQVSGIEVIPEASPVIGHVVAVGHSSFAGHSGKLGLSIDYAVAANGAKVLLRGEGTLKGGSNGAVTAAATAYYGPAALLLRGWEADIHKGTILNSYVNGEQTLTLQDSKSNK